MAQAPFLARVQQVKRSDGTTVISKAILVRVRPIDARPGQPVPPDEEGQPDQSLPDFGEAPEEPDQGGPGQPGRPDQGGPGPGQPGHKPGDRPGQPTPRR
jgi:hypothetical protein